MKHTKFRFLALVLALVFGIMSFTSCGGTKTPAKDDTKKDDSGSKADTTTSDTFLIGGIGPLTGDAATYGQSVNLGAKLAIEEINKAGGVTGKTFKMAFEDDQASEEKGVSAYNKLMDQKINVLMGSVTSGSCIAVAAESVKDGILQITPSGSAKDCTKNDNAFRVCFTDPLQGQLMAKYIKDKGLKSVAIIYDVSDEYSKGITEAFVAKAKEIGLKVVTQESFTKGDVDFKTQLTKIKSTDADSLFLPIYYTQAGYISEQAASVGLKIPYFGCDGWDGIIDQLKGNTKNIEGATFLTPFIASSEKQNVKDFVAAFKAKYNKTPDQFAADGYDTIYVIKAALEKAGKTDSAALIKAMTQIKVSGVTGDMTFDASGEPNKSAMVAIIKNGKYTAE
jgi:ABC-type branched-chain amino acid transport systems, periplasmic component